MSTPQFPFGMDPESLRDAPLFRELQRVMSSSSGPVQWELARQLAVTGAAEAGGDPEPDQTALAAIEEAVRLAELQVVDLTGLEPSGDVVRVELARRADWIATSMEAYRPLVEGAATRLAASLERAIADRPPLEDEQADALAALGMGSPQAMLNQLGPLLQASQVGQVFGFLAARVLADHDVGIPRPATEPIRFVLTNIMQLERDWSLDPREFRTFVALHQVVHRLQSQRPWLPEYASQLVDDFLATMTIDVDAIQQRFASLAPTDPESLQAAFGGEDEVRIGRSRRGAEPVERGGGAHHDRAAVAGPADAGGKPCSPGQCELAVRATQQVHHPGGSRRRVPQRLTPKKGDCTAIR